MRLARLLVAVVLLASAACAAGAAPGASPPDTAPATPTTPTTSTTPPGMAVGGPVDAAYGTVSCAATSSVCAFTEQRGDLYGDTAEYGLGRYCGCVTLRDMATGAVVAEIDVTEVPGAPRNANRIVAVHDPRTDHWFIAYHATRDDYAGDFDRMARPYGLFVDGQGRAVGATIALSAAPLNGWVPQVALDPDRGTYLVVWHQQLVDCDEGPCNVKDTYATVLGEDGTVLARDVDLDTTPATLDEYGALVHDPDAGQFVLATSTSGEHDCEDCTRHIDIAHVALDAAGAPQVLDRVRVDGDEQIEWGLSLDRDPVSGRLVLAYREGSTPRTQGGLTGVAVRVLHPDGRADGPPVTVGTAEDGYWVTDVACSAAGRCLLDARGDTATIDVVSSPASVTPLAPGGVGTFGFPSGAVAASAPLGAFVLYGGAGALVVAG